jgi:hypothetical protein
MNFSFVYIEEDEAIVEHFNILEFADFATLVPWHKGGVNEIIEVLSDGSFSEPLFHKTSIIKNCNLKANNLFYLIASELSKIKYSPIDYFFIHGLMKAPRKHSEPDFTKGSKIIPVSVRVIPYKDMKKASYAFHKEIFIEPSRSRTPRDFFQEIGGEEVLEKDSELDWKTSPPFQSIYDIEMYLKGKSKLRDNLFIVPCEKNHDLFGFADTL